VLLIIITFILYQTQSFLLNLYGAGERKKKNATALLRKLSISCTTVHQSLLDLEALTCKKKKNVSLYTITDKNQIK
jgi:hypothetical protein